MEVSINLDWSSELEDHFILLQELQHLITKRGDFHRVQEESVRVRIGLPCGGL